MCKLLQLTKLQNEYKNFQKFLFYRFTFFFEMIIFCLEIERSVNSSVSVTSFCSPHTVSSFLPMRGFLLSGFWEFDKIVDGNSIKKGKPDPEVFIEAAKLLKVPNNNSLVIEDSIAGIMAARRGGFMTAFVSSLPIPGDVMIYAHSLSMVKNEIEKRIFS